MTDEAWHHSKFFYPETLDSWPAIVAHDRWRVKPRDAIDKAGADKRRRDLSATFHEHPCQSRLRQHFHAIGQIDPCVARGGLEHDCAQLGKNIAARAISDRRAPSKSI